MDSKLRRSFRIRPERSRVSDALSLILVIGISAFALTVTVTGLSAA